VVKVADYENVKTSQFIKVLNSFLKKNENEKYTEPIFEFLKIMSTDREVPTREMRDSICKFAKFIDW